MSDDRDCGTRLGARRVGVLAGGLVMLALVGPAFATPPKGGGCGGCGGGGGGGNQSSVSRQDASRDAADRARDAVPSDSGITIGNGGRRNESTGGSIADLGAAEERERERERLRLEALENMILVASAIDSVTGGDGLLGAGPFSVSANDVLSPRDGRAGGARPIPAPGGDSPSGSSLAASNPANSPQSGQGPAAAADPHAQRGDSLDMLTVLNTATNRGAGRSGWVPDSHDVAIGGAQIQQHVDGLTGAATSGAASPAAAATASAPPQMIVAPPSPVDAPLLGSTSDSPTAVPPTQQPASGWQLLPPEPVAPVGQPAPPVAPPADIVPPPTDSDPPSPDPEPVAANPPASPAPTRDDFDDMNDNAWNGQR